MTTITIPKELIKEKELVLVPRKEYEALLELKKTKEFAPTISQKKALKKAENNLKKRKTLPYHEVAQKLGFTS